jgi:hypothetical protein
MKRESIFKVTRIKCWETGTRAIEYVKAYDVNHAMRIANRLFDDVALVQLADCE